MREKRLYDSALLHLRLRAEAQQARQGRKRVATRLGTARREIFPGHADHVHLHTQGDEGENQVRRIQKAIRKGAGTVQRLSADAGVPRIQRGADQPAGGPAGALEEVGSGELATKNRRRGTFQLRSRRYDDSGQPVDLPHQAAAPERRLLFHIEERDRRSGKGAVQVRGIVLRDTFPRDGLS